MNPPFSREEALERGLRIVPKWMPAAVALATILGTTGAGYATYGLRLTDLETRADRLDADHQRRLDEYSQFKESLAARLQSLSDAQQAQGQTLDRIAARLGVYR